MTTLADARLFYFTLGRSTSGSGKSCLKSTLRPRLLTLHLHSSAARSRALRVHLLRKSDLLANALLLLRRVVAERVIYTIINYLSRAHDTVLLLVAARRHLLCTLPL